MTHRPANTNRGLALINALVLVAALSAVTVLLLQKAQSARHRQIVTQEVTQAQPYLDGIELFVISILNKDRLANTVDHLREGWAISGGTVDIDRGTASYKITDLERRFSLEFLSGGDAAFGDEAFKTLMRSAGLKDAQITAIRAFFADGGPRNISAYSQQTPRILPQGRPPTILPELRQVTGITAADYDKIKTLLNVVRTDTINFNTAPPNLLRATLPQIPDSAMNTLLESRRQAPFESSIELKAKVLGLLTEKKAEEVEPVIANFGVSSHWFEAELVVTLGQTRLHRRVIFERAGDTGKTKAKIRFADN